MRSYAAIYTPPRQSPFNALVCLLLSLILNIQWLSASAVWTHRNAAYIDQSTISLINNGGDISATLNELGSSANVKSLWS